MTYLPHDRIRVFVSSRLGECETERTEARHVIDSLGHQPVMFEGAGARPHAPRSVYLHGLDESQIFVGIYREGYGYIADGMEISGLEDEYRYAKSRGIPQLLYVFRGGQMEPRLKALVDGFTRPDVTVSYFGDSSALSDRIRIDLITLVSEYFRRGTSSAQSSPIDPGVIAEALVPATRRLRRKNVEGQVETHLETNPVVLLNGPLGSGKTVFLSTLSSSRKWAFVECGEKAPQEVLGEAANAVRRLLELPATAFLLPRDAQAALQAAWKASQSVTLVLDDVRNTEALDQVRSATPVSNTHRLIVASRTDIPLAGTVYEFPPLDLEETREFVKMNRNEPLLAGELVEIHGASKGNPLYLRYYLAGRRGDYATDLAEYETRVWRSLSASAQEVLSYLAWADRPLSLADLAHLVTGSTGSAEELANVIESANSLLVESNGAYSVFHPHATTTIRDLTCRSRPRLQFYIERLSKWFIDIRDYVSAFRALNSSGTETSASLLEMAGQQAVVKGDFRRAVEILDAQIKLAKAAGDKGRERDLMLYLAHVVSLSGSVDQALEMIDEAADIPAQTEPPFDVSELKATIGALGKGDRQAFEQLLAKKDDYCKSGKLWDAARLSVDLSVFYARQNEPRKGADESEFAMRVFKENEDDYGFRIARGNYLSAISAMPGNVTETDTLIKEIEAETAEDPRQRALLCNVLGRRARERSDTAGAKAYAREAIEIGRDIGDNTIVCNNLMNLGNAYRDEANWESAIAQYEAADKLARESELVLAEAAAQNLLAAVFNRRGDGERALHHANYAISVARGVSSRIVANATENLAEAYELVHKVDEARDTWVRYAGLEIERTKEIEAGSGGFVRAAALMANEGDVPGYLTAFRRLYDIQPPKHDELSPGEHLLGYLPDLFRKVSLGCSFEAAVYHARLLFADIPLAMVRRAYMVAIRQVFGEVASDADALKRLRIALALSMAVPHDALRLPDLVDVGKVISRRYSNVSFRPGWDGAAHWTMELTFGRPVLMTVSQVDDRPDVSLVTLCLILVLVAFSPDIFEEVLSGLPPQRDAVNVQVFNFNEGRELLSLEQMGLTSAPTGCAVTRATDVGNDAGVPIFVVTSETLTKEWLVGSGRGNEGQALFAKVLVEVVVHLQRGEIQPESLYPKIVHVISKTIV